jgi:protoporphyrinogen/coproporphyrinogen III oxidase
MKIAIAGAGISGLTTAYYLRKYLPECNIDIFDKEARCGGKVQTITAHGFCIELGSNGFLSNREEVFDLVKELDCEDMLLRSEDSAKKRFIFDGNTVHKIPESAKEFISSSLLSIFSKFRVLLEFFIPRKKSNDEESLQSFGYRRLGKEFTNKLLDPMSAGVFASSADKLSIDAAFPLVSRLEKEYGSLIRGMMKKKKKSADSGGALVSFRNGMSSFIDVLSQKCGANIYLSSEIIQIQKSDTGWLLITQDANFSGYDKVIITSPSYIASRLLKNIDEELCEDLRLIEYSPIAIVALGYDDLENQLDGFGLLTMKSSYSQALGILWDSSIFKGRAEASKKLIRVMIGGQRNPTLAVKEENELVEIAIGAVMQIMHNNNKPLLTNVARWYKGIPNYAVGHLALVEKIFAHLTKHNGLYLNSNAYKGVSFNDCVKNSKELAIAISSR